MSAGLEVSPQSPLDVQELLDHCISFIPRCSESLRSCSLVARSWVDAAQSQLFREPYAILGSRFYRMENASRFCAALCSSPRLVGYVRALTLRLDHDLELNMKLCSVNFSRLESLEIGAPDDYYFEPEDIPFLHLQKLSSLSTLRSLELRVQQGFPFWAPLFAHISPTIQKFFLYCEIWDTDHSAVPDDAPSVKLKSLRLTLDGSPATRYDIQDIISPHMLRPFDLSQLIALEVHQNEIRWQIPAQTGRMIQILDICFGFLERFDPSALPQLTHLRLDEIPGGVSISVIDSLSTLPLPRKFHTMVVGYSQHLKADQYIILDRFLSCYQSSGPLVVEIETYDKEKAGIHEKYPIMSSQNQLRVVYRAIKDPTWFMDMVAKL
ncbi:hypothetical protein R3P38DRAFT_3108983 [Favolaschia claudopus]|uniref:F-box domain-containing protein n=1 Tax=Favolaschia claudopus TaxID=2862362 RepID=A0AAV9ZIQ6_9AGAR